MRTILQAQRPDLPAGHIPGSTSDAADLSISNPSTTARETPEKDSDRNFRSWAQLLPREFLRVGNCSVSAVTAMTRPPNRPASSRLRRRRRRRCSRRRRNRVEVVVIHFAIQQSLQDPRWVSTGVIGENNADIWPSPTMILHSLRTTCCERVSPRLAAMHLELALPSLPLC